MSSMGLISQESFDTVVKENQEEFEMGPEEAVQDALEQFRKSGVSDFSHIVLRSSVLDDENGKNEEDRSHPVENAANTLATCLKKSSDQDGDDENASVVGKTLADLVDLCKPTQQSNIAMLGNSGGAEVVTNALRALLENKSICDVLESVKNCAELVFVLSYKSVAYRLQFESIATIVPLLTTALHKLEVAKSGSGIVSVLRAFRGLARNSEQHKVAIATVSSLTVILRVWEAFSGAHVEIFNNTCALLRSLLAPDDFRCDAPECFQRARVLAGGASVLQSGLAPVCTADSNAVCIAVQGLHAHALQSDACREAWALLRVLAVSDEICKAMVEEQTSSDTQNSSSDADGVLVRCALSALEDDECENACLQNVLGWLRNVSARDECKARLCTDRTVGAIIRAIETRSGDSRVQENGCGVLGGLALRRKENASQIFKLGGLNAVVHALEKHRSDDAVCRTACGALRNLVSRDEFVRAAANADPRVERALRAALEQDSAPSKDLAYAALRDLGALRDHEFKASRYLKAGQV